MFEGDGLAGDGAGVGRNHRNGGRAAHVAVRGGDGGLAGGNAGHLAKVVDGGHLLIGRAQADVDIVGRRGGQHRQRKAGGLAHGNGAGCKGDVHFGGESCWHPAGE